MTNEQHTATTGQRLRFIRAATKTENEKQQLPSLPSSSAVSLAADDSPLPETSPSRGECETVLPQSQSLSDTPSYNAASNVVNCQFNDSVERRRTSRSSATLADLSGVHHSDNKDALMLNSSPTQRAKARVIFQPVHALAAVLLLTCALCASLTMLIQQSLNYAALSDNTSLISTTAEDSEEQNRSNTTAGEETTNGEVLNEENTDSNTTNTGDTTSENNESNSDNTSNNADNDNNSQDDTESSTEHIDDGRIDLNTAGLTELDTITGVGPVIAQRILDYRAQIGQFTSVDELLDVTGIGPKTLEKMRSQVVVR